MTTKEKKAALSGIGEELEIAKQTRDAALKEQDAIIEGQNASFKQREKALKEELEEFVAIVKRQKKEILSRYDQEVGRIERKKASLTEQMK